MKRIILVLVTFNLYQFLIAQDKPINLLVITGGPTLKHQIDLVPTSFYSLFMQYDNINWDHATHDEAAFQSEKLNSYDVILLYNRSDSISKESEQNLKGYLESGKGLIVLHHALGSYNNWEWWWKDVVGGKYQMVENELFPKSDYKQEEKVNMISQENHPISEAVGNFTFIDETYKKLWISKDVDVLYSTDNLTSDGPTVWISPYKTSKVIVIQPGHAKSAHLDSKYKNLIYQSILWAND